MTLQLIIHECIIMELPHSLLIQDPGISEHPGQLNGLYQVSGASLMVHESQASP